jgi:hypothetical protein
MPGTNPALTMAKALVSWIQEQRKMSLKGSERPEPWREENFRERANSPG